MVCITKINICTVAFGGRGGGGMYRSAGLIHLIMAVQAIVMVEGLHIFQCVFINIEHQSSTQLIMQTPFFVVLFCCCIFYEM